MSSILNALKKVEEERSAGPDTESAEMNVAAAEDELISRSRIGGGVAVRMNQSTLVLTGVVFATLLAAVSAGTSIAALRSRPLAYLPAPSDAAASPVPEQQVESQATTPVTTASVMPVRVSAPVMPQAPVEAATVTEEPPTPFPDYDVLEAQAVAALEQLEDTPAPAPTAKSAIVAPPLKPVSYELPDLTEPLTLAAGPNPAINDVIEAVNLKALPMLTEADMRRHGLPTLNINMLTMPKNEQARASAMVNYQVVYVGYAIPGTQARLIGVDMRGIGVEVAGERYYVPRRMLR